jgi:4'-phosphopantetheinyl transferase
MGNRNNIKVPGIGKQDQSQLVIISNSDFHPEEIRRLGELLTPEERLKSLRFRFPHDRDSYIIVHGLLRQLLGEYLDVPPVSVSIGYNAYGKPYLTGDPGRMFFNLSHSAGVSVLAFDPANEIGVDVEQIRKNFEYRPIVDRFFSDDDKRYLDSPGKEPVLRFYEIWTRKEALLKAFGTGITENLDINVFSLKDPGFSLTTMRYTRDYVISVAAAHRPDRIRILIPDGEKPELLIID